YLNITILKAGSHLFYLGCKFTITLFIACSVAVKIYKWVCHSSNRYPWGLQVLIKTDHSPFTFTANERKNSVAALRPPAVAARPSPG
ncbi:hypothetical protein, partial [Escherichia coli]|uniref:hypothetical protein n=1 Tax=Escherichia coli TaxID=562 RepID=UPI001BE7BEE2